MYSTKTIFSASRCSGGSLVLIQKRNRHVVRPQKPRMPTWKRHLMLEFATPKFTNPHETTENLWRDCPRHEEVQELKENLEPNPLEYLYAMQCRELFENSAMIGFFHTNTIKNAAFRRAWQTGRKMGLEAKRYERVMIKKAIEGTKWEPLMSLMSYGFDPPGLKTGYFERHTIVFSKDVKAGALLQLEKKVAECYFMGEKIVRVFYGVARLQLYLFSAAVVEDRILDRAGVKKLNEMPPLDVMLGQTCSLLQMPAQKTRQLLQSNQQNLSTNLKQYIQDQEKEE